jgi:hypothetical protein
VTKDNVILIGSRKSNPWVDLYEPQLNFTVEYDPLNKVSYIRNHNPQKGERATYPVDVTSPSAANANPDSYSVIACLPNGTSGNKVLIMAGLNASATDAAGEFLTSEAQLKNMKKLLGIGPMSSFEALLQTNQLSGTPIAARVIAYRVNGKR